MLARIIHAAIAVAAVIAAASCPGLSRPAAAAPPISEREFKLTLDPAPFGTSYAAASAKLWVAAQNDARQLGATVTPGGKARTKRTLVRFFDTPSGDLYCRNGLMLRARARAGKEAPTEWQLTLKSRGTDFAAVARMDPTALAGRKAKVELTEEPVWRDGQVVRLYSLAGTTRAADWGDTTTIAKAAAIFPALANYGPGNTRLEPVDGLTVLQVEDDLGILQFPGLVMQAALIVWYNAEGRLPLAAEFTFDHKVTPPSATPPAATMADRYLAALGANQTIKPMIAQGGTKTAMLYRRLCGG